MEQIINARKKIIQDGLHEELGILVDAPTQGSGNTNDGNTARRFFNNVDVVARITGMKIVYFRTIRENHACMVTHSYIECHLLLTGQKFHFIILIYFLDLLL